MKRVWLDLAQASPRRLQLLRVGLMAAGVMGFGYSGLQQWQLGQQREGLSWQLNNIAGEPSVAAQPIGTADRNQESLKDARLVFAQLNRPWNPLFKSLEAAIDKDVIVVSLAPNPQQGSLTVEGKAHDIDAVIRFLGRVKANPGLSDVYLQHEKPLGSGDAFPLQFKISAQWKAES